MERSRLRFDSPWVIASIAIGIIFTLAANIGAGKPIQLEFLAEGAFMGLCIYFANVILHQALGRSIERVPPSLRRSAWVAISVLGGLVGWEIAYIVLYFVETGTFALPPLSGRMRSLLLVTLAITVLVAALAHGYHQLRERLSESIEKLKESEFAEKELEVAREIQSRLLPPPMIEGAGFVITARNLAAHFVAGDFYDVLRHEDGSVGIVIADVSGKGLGASLIMASVKAVLPFVANGAVDETLRKLNQRLTSQLGRREFVALAYARFHPDTGKLQIANAGMPDPYIISGLSATPISVTGERLPLGVRDDIRYDAVEVELQPGDRFFLLSDGIPEATRANGEPLGYEALRETIRAIPPNGAWIDSMLDRVRAQVQSIDDDWTAVVLERKLER